MTLIGLLVLLLIAAICGGIGQSLAGYSLGGCLVSIVVGFIGAWIGLWIAGRMGLPKLFEITIDNKPFSSCVGDHRFRGIYPDHGSFTTSLRRKKLLTAWLP
jgi:uncharacterized membrane protein YeaQ/YmgE (transglycosylase-associated protein family)